MKLSEYWKECVIATGLIGLTVGLEAGFGRELFEFSHGEDSILRELDPVINALDAYLKVLNP